MGVASRQNLQQLFNIPAKSLPSPPHIKCVSFIAFKVADHLSNQSCSIQRSVPHSDQTLVVPFIVPILFVPSQTTQAGARDASTGLFGLVYPAAASAVAYSGLFAFSCRQNVLSKHPITIIIIRRARDFEIVELSRNTVIM